MSELPPKLYFRIGEVAGLVGVEPHVLRYWEREFRTIRPSKSAKGQRVYSRRDVENLLRVRDLLYRDGFTIAGAKRKLQRAPEVIPAPTTQRPKSPEDAVPMDDVMEEATPAIAEEISGVELTPTFAEEQFVEPAPHAREAQPSTRSASSGEASVREKLSVLRAEVESFLVELSTDH